MQNKAVQQSAQPLRGRLFNRDSAKPRAKRILVLKTGLAGIQHHVETEKEWQALQNLKPGTELTLYREPENVYDLWAVAVYLTEQDKLGYLTRFKNETIARLMDAGKKFIAVVDDLASDEEARQIFEEERRSRRAPTENMSVPISVYLVEE